MRAGFVNTSSGNMTFRRRDIVTRAQGPVVFARVYDSRIAANADLGPGWRLSLAEEILAGGVRTAVLADGEAARAFAQADASGARYVLSSLRTAARELAFGYADGRLATVRDLAGSDWAYRCGDDGLLATAVDPEGRTYLAADHDDAGRAVRVFADGPAARLRVRGRTRPR